MKPMIVLPDEREQIVRKLEALWGIAHAPTTAAEEAKARLKRVIAQDRERVPAWRWVRYRGYLIAWGVTFARKARYRWERRR